MRLTKHFHGNAFHFDEDAKNAVCNLSSSEMQLEKNGRKPQHSLLPCWWSTHKIYNSSSTRYNGFNEELGFARESFKKDYAC